MLRKVHGKSIIEMARGALVNSNVVAVPLSGANPPIQFSPVLQLLFPPWPFHVKPAACAEDEKAMATASKESAGRDRFCVRALILIFREVTKDPSGFRQPT